MIMHAWSQFRSKICHIVRYLIRLSEQKSLILKFPESASIEETLSLWWYFVLHDWPSICVKQTWLKTGYFVYDTMAVLLIIITRGWGEYFRCPISVSPPIAHGLWIWSQKPAPRQYGTVRCHSFQTACSARLGRIEFTAVETRRRLFIVNTTGQKTHIYVRIRK